MKSDLGNRLDELATRETRGLLLDHPGLARAQRLPVTRRRSLVALIAAAVAVIAILAGGWWASRPDTSPVATAGELISQPVLSLLLEEPVPVSELPDRIQDFFQNAAPSPPLRDLRPEAPSPAFDGVHVVNRDGVVVAVGLDTTGTHQCTAVYVEASDTGSASCGSPTGQSPSQIQSSVSSSAAGDVSAFVVPNGVVALEMGSTTIDVERNVAVLDGLQTGPLALVLADGSAVSADSFPDPTAVGQFSLGGMRLDAMLVTCLLVDDDFVFEASFFGDNGLISAVATPEGLFLTGGIDQESINVVLDDAVIETETNDGLLSVSARWPGEQSGSLQFDCGDNLLDLSEIR